MVEEKEEVAISRCSSKSGQKQITKVEIGNVSLSATQVKSTREREDSMNNKVSVFTKLNNGPQSNKSSIDKKTISHHSSKKRSLNRNSSTNSKQAKEELKKSASTVKNSDEPKEDQKEEDPVTNI